MGLVNCVRLLSGIPGKASVLFDKAEHPDPGKAIAHAKITPLRSQRIEILRVIQVIAVSYSMAQYHDALGPDADPGELDFEAAGLGDKSLRDRPNRLRCGARSLAPRDALASTDCSVAAIRCNVVAAIDWSAGCICSASLGVPNTSIASLTPINTDCRTPSRIQPKSPG